MTCAGVLSKCADKRFRGRLKALFQWMVFCVVGMFTTFAKAEFEWAAVTIDNDIFFGNDNGYTNGLYFSLIDVGDQSNEIPRPDFWVSPLKWSMSDITPNGAVNTYMIGQTMSTPSDITIPVPDLNELPYAALLVFSNNYVAIHEDFSDRLGTSIGLVGPAALGDEIQSFVHDIIGADEPLGWDTQIGNEIVFQFSRGRTWRSWESESTHFDFLTHADLSIGTIQSGVASGFTFRYGRDLIRSYATTLLNNSRTINPSAASGGWYLYLSVQAGYTFNQIFTDGNTFRDSRSIDYDRESFGVSLGFAYAWDNLSITFAISDTNILERGEKGEALEDLTQFGTLTVAWRN